MIPQLPATLLCWTPFTLTLWIIFSRPHVPTQSSDKCGKTLNGKIRYCQWTRWQSFVSNVIYDLNRFPWTQRWPIYTTIWSIYWNQPTWSVWHPRRHFPVSVDSWRPTCTPGKFEKLTENVAYSYNVLACTDQFSVKMHWPI